MGRKVTLTTILKRFGVQVNEVTSLREKSIERSGVDKVYTDYITCQGTNPARKSGKDHKKCGKRVSMNYAYKCLYCQFWFCGTLSGSG